MVLSTLTLYVVVVSCFALAAGRTTVITANSTETTHRSYERRKTEAKTSKGGDGGYRGAVSKFTPLNGGPVAYKPPEEDTQPHAYFALYDPIHNETKRFPGLKWWGALRTGGIKNFLARDSLPDSEHETRVHFQGLTAKETKVSAGIDPDTGKRQGLTLRQLTDGSNFIQLIYNNENKVQDCEFVKDEETIHKFLHTFRKDVEKARGHKVDDVYDEDTDFDEDESDIERYINEDELSDHGNDVSAEFRNVTFQVLEEELPTELAEWMDYQKLKNDCKENHRVLKQMLHYKDNGDDASKKVADEHFESFRACLKMARTGTANLVGKLFFNVVQTQCFVLKPEKVCKRRTWWGTSCQKYELRKKAYLKRNLAY